MKFLHDNDDYNNNDLVITLADFFFETDKLKRKIIYIASTNMAPKIMSKSFTHSFNILYNI